MIAIFIIDPGPYRRYDEQTWWLFDGDPRRLARRVGEWVWVGRVR